MKKTGEEFKRNKIFISHSTKNKEVADMLSDFLILLKVLNEDIFCSSRLGNGVDKIISDEVKKEIQKSSVFFLILSKEYYESAYCLNEAGIAWYLDEVTSIPIGLPEISHEKMLGFLDGEYILRRINNDMDVAYLVDVVQEKLPVMQIKQTVISHEIKKLKEK